MCVCVLCVCVCVCVCVHVSVHTCVCVIFSLFTFVTDFHRQPISRTVSSNSPYVDGRNRLVFTDANPTHSGQYRCTGVNAFGSNSTYSNVTIINPGRQQWV